MRCLAALLAGCGATAAAPLERAPSIEVAAIAPDALCATRGTVGPRIDEPTVRVVAPATRGDAALLAFRYLGPSARVRELASGDARHQVGLKLRAENGCNLVYVMWRADKPRLDVSIKLNPGMRTHAQCGAGGYTKLRGEAQPVPALTGAHVLRAEIVGAELTAWVDDRVAWRGELPPAAHALAGPAGLRTDNAELELVRFAAPIASGSARACPRDAATDDAP